MRYYGKIHSKLPIFRVKSVKIYTGQKKFTRTLSVRPWQIWGMIVNVSSVLVYGNNTHSRFVLALHCPILNFLGFNAVHSVELQKHRQFAQNACSRQHCKTKVPNNDQRCPIAHSAKRYPKVLSSTISLYFFLFKTNPKWILSLWTFKPSLLWKDNLHSSQAKSECSCNSKHLTVSKYSHRTFRTFDSQVNLLVMFFTLFR